MKWMIENWYKAPVFLAAYSLMFIFLFIYPENKALFLIWLHVPVYLLHETEEFIFPGGFPEMMSKMMLGSDTVPFELKRAVFWINIPFIVIGIPLAAVLATVVDIAFGLYAVYFTLFATLPHFISVIKMNRFYNPGLAASICLNAPVSLYTLWYLNSHQLISIVDNIAGALVALFCMAVPMVWQLLRAFASYHQMEKIDIAKMRKLMM